MGHGGDPETERRARPRARDRQQMSEVTLELFVIRQSAPGRLRVRLARLFPSTS